MKILFWNASLFCNTQACNKVLRAISYFSIFSIITFFSTSVYADLEQCKQRASNALKTCSKIADESYASYQQHCINEFNSSDQSCKEDFHSALTACHEINNSEERASCNAKANDALKKCNSNNNYFTAKCEKSSKKRFKADNEICNDEYQENLRQCNANAGQYPSDIYPDCPPGTQREILTGQCMARLAGDFALQEYNAEGCQPGWTRGPDDGHCVPAVQAFIITPVVRDGFFVVCPKGSKQDERGNFCRPSFEGDHEHEIDLGLGEDCPPGYTRDPRDGGCVPIINTMYYGDQLKQSLLEEFLLEVENMDDDDLIEAMCKEKAQEIGVIYTHFPELTIKQTQLQIQRHE